MARINIEPQFWTDIVEVAARMGDSDKAVGQALKLIKYAQDEYKKGKRLSLADFKARFSEHLMPEFARIEGDHVIVAGAAKFFGWLDKKKEAGHQGGVKSAESRRSKSKQNKAKPSKHQQAEPSSSISYSSSISDSGSSNENTSYSKPQAFIGIYCRQFKKRWGVNPPIQKKDAGIAKRLAEDLSEDRFEFLVDAYLAMPDSWIVKQKHPLGVFQTKLNEIAVFADTDKFHTTRDVRQADDMASNMKLLKDIEEGKI